MVPNLAFYNSSVGVRWAKWFTPPMDGSRLARQLGQLGCWWGGMLALGLFTTAMASAPFAPLPHRSFWDSAHAPQGALPFEGEYFTGEASHPGGGRDQAPSYYLAAPDGSFMSHGNWGTDGWYDYLGPEGYHAAAEGVPYLAGSLAEFNAPPGRQWYFGAYALYMTRDTPGYRRLAVEGGVMGPSSYPGPDDTVLSTRDVSPEATWGAEIRFGSTLGPRMGHGGRHQYAWELAYWGLTEDQQSATYSRDFDPIVQIYGSVDYAGLGFNRDGTGPQILGLQWLNYFFNYHGFPSASISGVYPVGVRARNDFKAQNLELNFLRVPLYGGQQSPNSVSVTTVGGVRYLKFDEEFQNAVMYLLANTGSGLPPHPSYPNDPTEFTGFGDDVWNIYHDIEVDNQLVGFQLGANLNWAVSPRWDLFCDGMVGVFNNRVEVLQQVYSGGDGLVQFAHDLSPAVVRAKKNDIAFMGELRTGVGYQVTSHLRLTAAHRVMAISGVALAVEQISPDWWNPSYPLAIKSNDSLILHGLQLGAEFVY